MNNERRSFGLLAVILTAVGLLTAISSAVFWLNREKPDIPKLDEIEIALADTECSCLLLDGEFIYAGGADGLYMLDSATLTLIEKAAVPDSPVLQLVSALYKMPDGSVWAAHNRGISVRRDGIWKTFGKEDGLADLRANCFYPEGGGLWAGTWGGAYFFAESGGSYSIQKSYTADNGLTDNMIFTIYSDSGGALWFGAYYHSNTPCGLSIFSNGRFSYLSVADGLPHSFITSVCELPGDEYYVGCGYLERGGLAVVRKHADGFSVGKTYSVKEGLPGPKVRTLYYDSAGRLWVATENDGLLIVSNPNSGDNYLLGAYIKKENGLPDNEIKQIIEYDGCFYLAARRGIARIPAGAGERYCNF